MVEIRWKRVFLSMASQRVTEPDSSSEPELLENDLEYPDPEWAGDTE